MVGKETDMGVCPVDLLISQPVLHHTQFSIGIAVFAVDLGGGCPACIGRARRDDIFNADERGDLPDVKGVRSGGEHDATARGPFSLHAGQCPCKAIAAERLTCKSGRNPV